jgi:mono/diheme cytochrome c family protein
MSLWLALTAVMFSCKQYSRNGQFAAVKYADIVRGEALAKQYCQSCHMLPDPQWLDAATDQEYCQPWVHTWDIQS